MSLELLLLVGNTFNSLLPDPKYWLFHPEIYPAIKDDRNPDDIDLPGGCIYHYYPGGMIAYHRVNGRLRIHPHILPAYRNQAKRYVMDSIEKIGEEVECFIPECFRHVRIFAGQCGFKVVSIVPDAYLREGVFYSSTLMVRLWAL